jgi:hypothetical protein
MSVLLQSPNLRRGFFLFIPKAHLLRAPANQTDESRNSRNEMQIISRRPDRQGLALFLRRNGSRHFGLPLNYRNAPTTKQRCAFRPTSIDSNRDKNWGSLLIGAAVLRKLSARAEAHMAQLKNIVRPIASVLSTQSTPEIRSPKRSTPRTGGIVSIRIGNICGRKQKPPTGAKPGN